MSIIVPMLQGYFVTPSSCGVRRDATDYATLMSNDSILAPTNVQTRLNSMMVATGGGSCYFDPAGAIPLAAYSRQGRLVLQHTASFSIRPHSLFLNLWPYYGFTQVTGIVNAVNNPALFPSGWGIVADMPVKYAWFPELPPRRDSLDKSMRPNSTNNRSLSGYSVRIDEPSLYERKWDFAYISAAKMFSRFAVNDRPLQEFMENINRFRYWEDCTVAGTFNDYSLSQDTLQAFEPVRDVQSLAVFSHDIKGWRYV